MKVRVEHRLENAEVQRRLRELAQRHEVSVDAAADDLSGILAKDTPLGRVRASYALVAGAVEVEVLQKPAFVPERMARRRIEEGLREILS